MKNKTKFIFKTKTGEEVTMFNSDFSVYSLSELLVVQMMLNKSFVCDKAVKGIKYRLIFYGCSKEFNEGRISSGATFLVTVLNKKDTVGLLEKKGILDKILTPIYDTLVKSGYLPIISIKHINAYQYKGVELADKVLVGKIFFEDSEFNFII